MKTTKKIAALSLMLLFAVVTVFSANAGGITPAPAKAMVRHLVTVASFNEQPINVVCVVELRNESGQLVAPPQAFQPGKSEYLFQERPFAGEGVRIASMRALVNTDPWQSELQMTVEPFVIKGTFEAGKTYRYFLQPKLVSGKE
jgi:hypothetical protein